MEVFPHAEWVSRELGGVPAPNLIEILRQEREFHRRIQNGFAGNPDELEL